MLADHVGFRVAEIVAYRSRQEALFASVEGHAGVRLPVAPRWVAAGRLTFVWAGPGRWLALEPDGPPTGQLDALAEPLSTHAAFVWQSDGWRLFSLGGPKVGDALRKGITVDLHPRAFPAGFTSMTMIADIDVHLWRCQESPEFRVLVHRSFAPPFCSWLVAAAAEHGLEVRRPLNIR
jgi:sarcosine oxidase subunit gamma